MSRTKNAIVNTIFGSLQKVLQMLLPFVMRSIMLHTLGIGYLGLNGLFTSVLQTLSIAELGIAGAITYNMYLPIARKDTDQVGRLLRLYRILYAVIGLTEKGYMDVKITARGKGGHSSTPPRKTPATT
mgnify:CR=1 FL=1